LVFEGITFSLALLCALYHVMIIFLNVILVRVLYSLACVKQWGGERCFTLFRLVGSIVPDVRCIDVFTHNSLRNKGDSLTTIVRHI